MVQKTTYYDGTGMRTNISTFIPASTSGLEIWLSRYLALSERANPLCVLQTDCDVD
jgi:hypothetical protein